MLAEIFLVHQDVLVIGNQSRPDIFALNIVRPPPLYSKVIEVDERVTLVGYTSDPKYNEHMVKFDEEGKVVKWYSGLDAEPEEEQGEVVRGLSGEAVRIIKKPGGFVQHDR
jgi:5-oxoprolinase (ATP-hydrolysing)